MKIEYLILPSSIANTSTITSNSINHRIKQNKKNKPNLTDIERENIYLLLSKYSFNGKLPHGILGEISSQFGVKPRTISRIWHQGQDSIRKGFIRPNVCSKIKFNSGRKKSCTGNVVKMYQGDFRKFNNFRIN